jgi:hypothetical protein
MLWLATAAVLAFERWVTEDSPHLASHRMSACAAINRGGVVVCGSQMVSHGRGKLAQVDAQEDGAILVLACGEESQHLIHEVGLWIPIYNYSYRKFIYVSILEPRQ